MGWRFSKSIRIGKAFRINLSKKGIGASVGAFGARIGVGPRGVSKSFGIPGTGVRWTSTSKGAGGTIGASDYGGAGATQGVESPSLNGCLVAFAALVLLVGGLAFAAVVVAVWIDTDTPASAPAKRPPRAPAKTRR